jgi:hypothetical protein
MPIKTDFSKAGLAADKREAPVEPGPSKPKILTNDSIDYDILATKITAAITRMPNTSDVLWNADECADYLRVGRRYFSEQLCKTVGFPRRRATGGLWFRSEVVRWAKR